MMEQEKHDRLQELIDTWGRRGVISAILKPLAHVDARELLHVVGDDVARDWFARRPSDEPIDSQVQSD